MLLTSQKQQQTLSMEVQLLSLMSRSGHNQVMGMLRLECSDFSVTRATVSHTKKHLDEAVSTQSGTPESANSVTSSLGHYSSVSHLSYPGTAAHQKDMTGPLVRALLHLS